jgi:nucleoid-associated protein YgaU
MALNRGKHRKQSRVVRGIAKVALAGAVVGVPMAIAAAPANASTVNWDAIAQCESSGNWAASTGNGFYGGLQFTESTWLAYGGGQYSSSANGASRSQQIAVAEQVLAGQGIHAWPVCGARGGSSGGGSVTYSRPSTTKVTHTAPSTTTQDQDTDTAATSAPTSAPKGAPNGDYTVTTGDTLSGIAQRLNVVGGWNALWDKNKSAVANPNLIFPGQSLVTK